MSIPITDVLTPRTALVVVPDALYEAINAKLDAAIAALPDAARDREALYQQLLAFFDQYGYLPEFEIGKASP